MLLTVREVVRDVGCGPKVVVCEVAAEEGKLLGVVLRAVIYAG